MTVLSSRLKPSQVGWFPYNYGKADWDGLKEHMSKYLDSIVHSPDCDLSINDLWSSFQEELTSGIKRFKPHRLTSSRNGLLLHVHVPPSLKCLMRKQYKLHAKCSSL